MLITGNIRHVLLLGCSILVGFPSMAAAESLESTVQLALKKHPSVEAAQAFLDAAGQERRSEFSNYFPQVSLGAYGGRMYGDNSTSRGLSVTRGAGYSNLWEGTASLRQPIFDGFETPARVSAARAREKSADMELMDVQETLALRAAQSYIDVMRTHAALDMLRRHEKKVDDYLSRIKSAVDQGAADEAEYQQARDVKVILEGIITNYTGQAKAAEAMYFEATGTLPKGEMDVPKPDISLIAQDMEAAIAGAKQNHPALKSAVYSSAAAHESIRAERGALYPGVDGELSYLKSEKDDILGGEVVDARAVVRMNWDFETGGGQIFRVGKRKHELYEAEARASEVERRLEAAIRQAYGELDTAKKQYGHQKERLDLNKKLFDAYSSQFEGARIKLLQLMQADNQLFNVELEKLNAEYRILGAQYTVLASLGNLQKSITLASAIVDDGRK